MVGNVFSAEAVARIEAAIAAAEAKSRAELVAMVTPRASEYRATGLAVSALAAFVAGAVSWLVLPWASAGDVLLVQMIAFPAVLAVMELSPLGDRLTPARGKAATASRLAHAAFLRHGLADTPERNAVLFFVSLAEHHVEIVADIGIHAEVGGADWQRIVDAFAARAKSGAFEAGLIDAIAALGDRLAQHFPAEGPRRSTVSNRLVMLESDPFRSKHSQHF